MGDPENNATYCVAAIRVDGSRHVFFRGLTNEAATKTQKFLLRIYPEVLVERDDVPELSADDSAS